ncbi:ABC-three component system protein [Vagococcus fluvialis]|uniref:ABC-three component system protein n=1 Tax=Vagococcus fluvialis TaxID=2738 RepID=UPI003D0D263E
MNKYFIEELKQKYNEKKIIPFVGAGLSIPFDLKPWKKLIEELADSIVDPKFLPSIEFELENGEYQEAIESIKKFARIDDQPIQEKIEREYSLRKNDLVSPIDNNYLDLEKNNFKIYLTTNYDRLLDDYIPNINSFRTLTEYTSDFQKLTRDNDEKYLFHIHGCVSNSNSIVISSKKYDELYRNTRFDNLMKGFSSNYSYLFLGFSFGDTFVRELIKNHKGFFSGTHYAFIGKDSISNEIKDKLSKEYGIRFLEYNITESSHIQEIRKLINIITNEDLSEVEESNDIEYPTVGLEELVSEIYDYSGSLFYRKLELANIGEDLIEVSKLFYIASEKFIRRSQKYGLPKEFIDGILAEVFMSYKEKYAQLYSRQGFTSEELLIEMHQNLDKINIDRLVTNKNKPTGSENKGFIHILADDGANDVWWSDDRI